MKKKKTSGLPPTILTGVWTAGPSFPQLKHPLGVPDSQCASHFSVWQQSQAKITTVVVGGKAEQRFSTRKMSPENKSHFSFWHQSDEKTEENFLDSYNFT